MEEKTTKNVKSFSIGIGASLHVLFPQHFLGIDSSLHSQKVAFVFRRTHEIEKAINEFYSGELKIPPASLLESVKLLKQRASDLASK